MKAVLDYLLGVGKVLIRSRLFWTVVIVFLLYLIFRKNIKQLLQGITSRDELKDVNKNVDNLVAQGIKPTHSEDWYETSANNIERAFKNGAADPTDEPAIYGIMSQLNNILDVKLLIKEFGVRTYKAQNWFGGSDEQVTLPQYCIISLSPGERAHINSMLKVKRIDYTF